MRVCQYLSNTHPLYLRMVSNSISMLRRHNDSIKIRMYLIHDGGEITKTTNHLGESLSDKLQHSVSDYVKMLRDIGTEVIERDPLNVEGEEGFFHIHRSLFKDSDEESLLFIDADTFVFNDIEYLFDKYAAYDYVGLPISNIDGWDSSWLPFKPYNSAVNLWNNGWIRKFAEALPSYCKRLREKKDPIAKWCYQQCYRGTGREETATSIFVSDNGLKHVAWEKSDVRNSSTITDYKEAPSTCIFHTFTHNWHMANGMYIGKRRKIKPNIIKAKDYEAKYRCNWRKK